MTRPELLESIRREIERGTYLTPERLAVAVAKMVAELEGDDG